MAKEIILKRLSIENFKGIKDFKLCTNGSSVSVLGENGTGKTTIQDAFTFLLFDKDSKDSAKFDVQPLDKKNNPIHNLETVIEAILNVDGKELTLKRIYKEKYTKVRGTSKLDFKGYESEYYINEVPQKVTEYKKVIGTLLDENIFKLVTNPVYFSSLPWKDRREIITEIVGDLDNLVVLDSKKELEPLRKHLAEYTVNEFMKMNKAKVNKLKEDRCKLPVRIDEANKSIQEFDFEGLELQKKDLSVKIKQIDSSLMDKSKLSEGLYKLKSELMKKQSELTEIEYKFKLEANKPSREIEEQIRNVEISIRHLKRVIEEHDEEIERKEDSISILIKKKDLLLGDYKEIKASTFEFDEEKCICPTCKRKFEAVDIDSKREELEGNFNSNKAQGLQKNINAGKSIAAQISSIKSEIEEINQKIKANQDNISKSESFLKSLKGKSEDLKTESVEDPEEVKSIKKEIEGLKIKIENFKIEDVSDLKSEKQELQMKLSEVDRQLAFKETNKKTLERIKELEEEEAVLSERIAEFEGFEMLSEDFIRTKVELLEEKVNSKFKYVSFKMFRNQINGGLEECCEPCVDGVPFTSNLNTAAKINAGLDIINTLCSHYEVQAPIFIDNRESTNKIIPVESQVINLIVSKDKELKIEVAE